MYNKVSHNKIKSNGISLHVAEKGTGPLVVLLHGFPELWYSWRHQIGFLADRGYHVVAPDLRGYGDSDAPASIESYTIFHLVGDIVGLIDHFGEQQAHVVGFGWGAVIGWNLSLFRPDKVKCFVAISVPYFQRDPNTSFLQVYRQVYGDGFHMCQFQEPGKAERSFARYDYLTVIKKFLRVTKTNEFIASPGKDLIDCMETPFVLPPWISEGELQVYADKFQETGFSGALNYYRCIEKNWELLAPWQGAKITVPAKLIIGDQDYGFESTMKYIQGDAFKNLVPNLELTILDGCHHYIHIEKAQEVSQETLSFFLKLSAK
jgi:pimeloyl-ACP methyl ester carboxylesterase